MTRLDEIRTRVEAATKGPWAVHPVVAQVDAFADGGPLPVCQLLWPTDLRSEAETEANALLIAHARQDIPYLLSRVETLTRALRELVEASQSNPRDFDYWEHEAVLAEARKRARAALSEEP